MGCRQRSIRQTENYTLHSGGSIARSREVGFSYIAQSVTAIRGANDQRLFSRGRLDCYRLEFGVIFVKYIQRIRGGGTGDELDCYTAHHLVKGENDRQIATLGRLL